MRDLYAVATPKGGRLCPRCALERFGNELETMPGDHTLVLADDAWRNEIDGPCDRAPDCLEWVGDT